MKRIWGISVVVTLALAASGAAQAQNWQAVSSDAEELRNPTAIAALFWSQQVDCATANSDLAKRQCEGIRKARIGVVSAGTYLLLGDQRAVELGNFDPKKKSAEITVRTCLACEKPLTIEGKPYYLVGNQGAIKLAGDQLLGPDHFSVFRKFSSKEIYDKWRSDALPRLRAEFVVKVTKKDATWKKGALSGYKVNIVGVRVHDPCDGKIIAAKPQAGKARADKRYCTGEPVVEKVEPEPVKVVGPVKPKIPARLSPSDIKTSLRPAREAANKCLEVYGVPGTARFRISISDEGAVVGLKQEKGDFIDTPTGTCIEKAIKGITFPKSKKKKTTVDYPFMLR
jgi:hypothetical protein